MAIIILRLRKQTKYRRARSLFGRLSKMGEFVRGVPKCWLAWTEGEAVVQGQGEKILKILLNFTASANVPASVIQTRGAAVCALIEALEYAGRRCEVVVTHVVAANGGDVREDVIVVKRAEHPLQLDQLAFVLGHPAMLRRLHFAFEETLPKSVRENFGFFKRRGHGHPRATSERADIVVPEADGAGEQWASADTARAWVMKCLREQGVQLAE